MVVQPIEDQAYQPTAGYTLIYPQSEMKDHPISLGGGMWTAYRVPQPLLAFYIRILATNEELQELLAMLGWHRYTPRGSNSGQLQSRL